MIWVAALLVALIDLAGWGGWLPIPLRITCAVLTVFFLPGRLLARALTRDLPDSPLERVALCAGWSIAVAALLLILVVEVHASTRGLAWFLVASGALGLLAEALRARHRSVVPPMGSLPGDSIADQENQEPTTAPPQRLTAASASPATTVAETTIPPPIPPQIPIRHGMTPIGWIAVGVLVILLVVFYRIGGFAEIAPDSEELLHLSVIRKLHANPHLTLENGMYRPHTPSTYLYAPYHGMVAITAWSAALDPVVAFALLRPFLCLIAIAAAYGALRQIVPDRLFADVGLLALATLVGTNVAGQVLTFYWGQLAPFSHASDFALGVLFPLLVYFALRYLAGERLWSSRLAGLVALGTATTLIHVRETVQILLLLGLWGIVLTLTERRGWREWLPKLIVPSGALVLFAFLYLGRHHALVEHVIPHEQAGREMVLGSLRTLARSPWGGVFDQSPNVYFRDPYLFRSPHWFWIAISPLFLWSGWPRGIRLLGGSVAGFIVFFRLPILAFLFTRFTYSEILLTPLRYVVLQNLLLTAAAAYGLFRLIDARLAQLEAGLEAPRAWRRRAAFCFGVAIFVAVMWGGVVRSAGAWMTRHHNAVYGAVFLGLVALPFLRGRLTTLAARAPRGFTLRTPRHAAALAAAIAIGLFAFQARPSLVKQLTVRRQSPPVTSARWYDGAGLERRLPEDAIRLARALPLTPSGDPPMVAADFSGGLLLPAFANVAILNSAACFSTDIDPFVAIVKRVRGEKTVPAVGDVTPQTYLGKSTACYQIHQQHPPLFSPDYTTTQQLAFLRIFSPEYLLVTASRHPHLAALIQSHPELFDLVDSAGDTRAYRLTRPPPLAISLPTRGRSPGRANTTPP